jgi:hypothetical protein
VNDDIKSGSAKASARRRLIRGVFASPAALTLCSGSAFAQASNQRCVANQVTGDPQFPSVGPADTWVRVSVWVHQNGAGPQTRLVSGTRVAQVQGSAGNSFIRSGQWKQIAKPFNEFIPTGSRPIETREFVALLVNDRGVIVGISDGTTVGGVSAIAKSCWTSFSGAGFRA